MSEDHLDISSEDQFPLFEIGQSVDTPEGPGTIVDISVHAARYGDRIELEPPAIKVQLDSGEVIHVCMCKLGLNDPKKEMIVSKEFQRLWPPITDDLPEFAHQLVDVESPQMSIGELPKWEEQKKSKQYIKYSGVVYKLVK